MWHMFGHPLDWQSLQGEGKGEEMALDPDDSVHVGDIVKIATRAKKPVLMTSENFNDVAQLRIVGEAKGDRLLYLCLVTAGDAEHVNPTVIIDKGKQAHNYGVDPFFYGCDGIIISDLHIRGIAKKQRGRFCEKCTEYNEDVRTPLTEVYLCLVCRENPYR